MIEGITELIALEHRAAVKRRRATETLWQAKAQTVYDWSHPWQQNVLNDASRRVCLLCGARAGKTTCICYRFLRRMMLTQGARCLYIATSREQAIDLLWNPLKDFCHELGLEPDFHETNLRCYLPDTDSRLRLVGADDKKQIEKYRGQPFHEVWIDEAASFDHALLDHLVNRVIGPRLGDYHGMLGLAGTPGHHLDGIFYEASMPGGVQSRHWDDRETKPEAEWSLHTWCSRDAAPYAPRIANAWEEALVNKAKKGWSDQHPVFMREVLGYWAADDTDAVFRYRAFKELEDGTSILWNRWTPEKDPVGVAKLPTHLPKGAWRYVQGWDLGFSDPTALEVFAWNIHDPDKRLYHVFEHEQRELYARAITDLLIGEKHNHEKPGGVIGSTGWPDGTAVDPASMGEAMLKELREVYGIHLELADLKDKFSAIELFNGDLIDGRIVVMEGSTLEDQLVKNQWSRDDFGQRKRNKGQRDDCADAAVYARVKAQHLFSEEAPAPKPAQAWQSREPELPRTDMPGEFDSYMSDDYWG